MSNAVNFVNSYANNVKSLVDILNTLQSQNLQMTEDSTLVTRYFSTPPSPGFSGPRTDINAQDVANAQNAVVQMLFTYNSGSPAQSAALLKMMP